MKRYNIVADRHAAGNWLVMEVGTDFVASSHHTYEGAEQAVRILNGSDEAWTNGKEYPRDEAGRIVVE